MAAAARGSPQLQTEHAFTGLLNIAVPTKIKLKKNKIMFFINTPLCSHSFLTDRDHTQEFWGGYAEALLPDHSIYQPEPTLKFQEGLARISNDIDLNGVDESYIF